MRNSFFSKTVLQVTGPVESTQPKCGLCKYYKTCKSPKMPVIGKGKKKILVVGDFPSKDDDQIGKQFSGSTGRLLSEVFLNAGRDFRDDCWLTNSLICRPPSPLDDNVIQYCRPNLLNTIKELSPNVIILLGTNAVSSLIGYLWKEKPESIHRWAGYRIPSTRLNSWICPTFHPKDVFEEKNPVMGMMFQKHIRSAINLKGKPYDVIPDYHSRIKVELDPDKASKYVTDMIAVGEKIPVIAFDYETNCLKPDSSDAKIFSCSISDGITSVAFPWIGKVKSTMGDILKNPRIRKIGCNCKFEDRWTRKEFGHPVEGWLLDTMLTAHALENASKIRRITSIKFQAFVKLGVDKWDTTVDQFLHSKDDGGNSKNNIHKADLHTLLKYNALDSLYEFLVGKEMMKTLKEGWK